MNHVVHMINHVARMMVDVVHIMDHVAHIIESVPTNKTPFPMQTDPTNQNRFVADAALVCKEVLLLEKVTEANM